MTIGSSPLFSFDRYRSEFHSTFFCPSFVTSFVIIGTKEIRQFCFPFVQEKQIGTLAELIFFLLVVSFFSSLIFKARTYERTNERIVDLLTLLKVLSYLESDFKRQDFVRLFES